MSLPGPVLGMRCTAPSFWAARPSITVLPTGAPGDRMPCTLHREPVPTQQQHVDVNVFAARPPRRQLDGVPTGDPPRNLAAAEDLRYLGRAGWFPGTPTVWAFVSCRESWPCPFFLIGADSVGVDSGSMVGQADRMRRDRRERH
jgi:hypothetical protein